MSDLETAPDDVPSLARTIAEIGRAGIRLRIAPLAPSSDALSLFEGLLEEDAIAGFAAQSPDADEPESRTAAVELPTALLVLGAFALLFLAAHERLRRSSRAPARATCGRRRLVTRRELLERIALGIGAAVCLALALGLGLLALDVARSRDALAQDDVQFRISPERVGLWRASTIVPSDLAVSLIGTEDDVELRRAVRSVRLARLDDPTVSVSDPEVALLRNDAQARLDAIVAGNGKPETKSRAAGLLGVIGLSRLGSETQDRTALLSATVANLQLAIALDPSNDEAKYNLELALQRSRGVQLTEGAGGQNPSPGGSGSSGAGAGDPGSGY